MKKSHVLLIVFSISAMIFYLFLVSQPNENINLDVSDRVVVSDTPHQLNIIQQTASEVPKNSARIEMSKDDSSIQPDFIVNCEHLIQQHDPNSESIFQDFLDYLAKSKQVNNQLAHSLFAPKSTPEAKLDSLLSYNQNYPGNPMVLMELIGLCSQVKGHKECNQNLIEQATAVDGENGALWLSIANWYAGQRDESATLMAMGNATQSDYFDEYYFANIALFMDVSKGALGLTFSQRALAAIGIQAAHSLFMSDILEFCVNNPATNSEVNQQCLALGQVMEKQSRTDLVNIFGIAIQAKVYKNENNTKLFEDTKAKQKARDKTSNTDLTNKAFSLALADEKLFQYWLNQASEQGEIMARQRLVDEAIVLSNNPYYLPCPR